MEIDKKEPVYQKYNDEMQELLCSLKGSEKLSFELNNKDFVILTKLEYNNIKIKSNAFDLIEKLNLK